MALLLLLAASRPGQAQEAPAIRALPVDLVVDGSLTGAGLVAWLLAESLLKPALAPERCRWCEPPGVDRAVREALVWDDTLAAEWVGNVSGVALAPAAALGLVGAAAAGQGSARTFGEDALVVGEALAAGMLVVSAVKYSVGRERPVVDAGRGMLATLPAEDANLAFVSGHTALAFSLATAAGTVGTLRGYRLAPALWAAGLGLAALTAYARVAADAHWLSDVVGGALIGAAAGVLVPLALHRPSGPAALGEARLAAGLTAGGWGLTFGLAW